MIPLSDASREPRNFPAVTVAIILVNAIVFLFELMGGDAFVMRWSTIPADIVAGRHWGTMLTSMFMHAGWMHIIGNMVFLWAFGPEIEAAMGMLRYLAFYLLCGLVASLAQIAVMPHSTIPNLGASGAIAGGDGSFHHQLSPGSDQNTFFLWLVRAHHFYSGGAADRILVLDAALQSGRNGGGRPE